MHSVYVYLFQALQGFWHVGKPGKLGIILCFPVVFFFANQKKPGKGRIFIPGFPGFNWCFTGKLGVIFYFPSFFAYREKPGKRGHSGFLCFLGNIQGILAL